VRACGAALDLIYWRDQVRTLLVLGVGLLYFALLWALRSSSLS